MALNAPTCWCWIQHDPTNGREGGAPTWRPRKAHPLRFMGVTENCACEVFHIEVQEPIAIGLKIFQTFSQHGRLEHTTEQTQERKEMTKQQKKKISSPGGGRVVGTPGAGKSTNAESICRQCSNWGRISQDCLGSRRACRPWPSTGGSAWHKIQSRNPEISCEAFYCNRPALF
jgi:hypothetical protein